jgi:hypothetical protein
MFDRLRSKEAATVSAVLALGLGVTACGGGSNSGTETTPPTAGTQKTGHKITYYKDDSVTVVDSSGYYAELKEFCQGNMFVAETFDPYGYGSSVDTQADSPYCADGKLTPSDFQLPAGK